LVETVRARHRALYPVRARKLRKFAHPQSEPPGEPGPGRFAPRPSAPHPSIERRPSEDATAGNGGGADLRLASRARR